MTTPDELQSLARMLVTAIVDREPGEPARSVPLPGGLTDDDVATVWAMVAGELGAFAKVLAERHGFELRELWRAQMLAVARETE